MIDPRETERDAYLAAAIPTNYTDNEIVQLFARGYDRYVVNNTPDRETLLFGYRTVRNCCVQELPA